MESQNSLFIHEIREKSYFKSNFSDKSLMSIESNYYKSWNGGVETTHFRLHTFLKMAT
jgi:hypothetical protein